MGIDRDLNGTLDGDEESREPPWSRVGSPVAPPVVTAPAQKTVEADGPAGAIVGFDASALDPVDGHLPAVCAPASGLSAFPLGTTTVTCTALNSGGVSGSATILVTVQDTTPLRLDLPPHQRQEATGPDGTAIVYDAVAIDIVDGSVDAAEACFRSETRQ